MAVNLQRLAAAARRTASPMYAPSAVTAALPRARPGGSGWPSSWQRYVSSNESVLSGSSSTYIDEMYIAWKEDPSSVHRSWQVYFKKLGSGQPPAAAFIPPPALGGTAPVAASSREAVSEHMKVLSLVRAYQVRGHNISNLDPLGMFDADLDGSIPAELELETYGFTDADLDREFYIGNANLSGFMSADRPMQTLREIVNRCQEVYCATIGVEYMHISNRDECNWIRDQIETRDTFSLSAEEKLRVWDRLCWSDHFERFLASKYSTAKRFGLEGCEVLVPGMKEMIDTAVLHGCESVIFGMPHRGRLNVLANVVRKPLEQILQEFGSGVDGKNPMISDSFEGSGDVKYHLGMSYDRPTHIPGKRVHLSLLANPSHLEAVNPVVAGKTRAKQHLIGDVEQKKVMSVLLHGDAAFSGQGVVWETLGFSALKNYSTGGTIHIVVNNQIGFTTDPHSSRSTPYSTDVAKAIDAPIFHVNGDDVEAVVRCFRIAAKWRQQFGKDVVVDIVCYRRHGHNEIDEPMFTQPLMYKCIKQHRPTWDQYSEKLVQEGVLTIEQVQDMSNRVMGELQQKLEQSRDYVPKPSDWLASHWQGFKSPTQLAKIQDTGVDLETLKALGTRITQLPSDFNPHRKMGAIYRDREKMINTGEGLDWAMGEMLAWGTLLREGNHVRISGQDVERGTFSHRHAVLHDQMNNSTYVPLNHSHPEQAAFHACNSSLSEYGVLGFELGYSLETPNALVMWEAQFGDFANTAQCIIDQFICSGEQKWLRQSGLVMLLPHGYDGQGPEHSSCRLERFLQMSDEHPDIFPEMSHEERRQIQITNWQIVNCTTPAQIYHVMRRQIHREFRKPLVVVSPKNLLRHPMAKSTLEQFGPGTRFRRFLKESEPEALCATEKVRRLVLCSGKVYYELLQQRQKKGIDDVALARVEQLCPFPFDKVLLEASAYPNAEIVWCQEEPMNGGAWQYVAPRIETALRESSGARPRYVGRKPAAAPGTGSTRRHLAEQEALIEGAFA